MRVYLFVVVVVLQDNGQHGNNNFLGSPIHKASMQMNPVFLPFLERLFYHVSIQRLAVLYWSIKVPYHIHS